METSSELQPHPAPCIYTFGPFKVDAFTRVALRAGERVAIGNRAFDLLLAFLRNPGEVLSGEDLILSAWPTTRVADGNLRTQIFLLRRILAGSDNEKFIQNMPGRGYRFVGVVETALTAAGRQPDRQARPAARSIIGRNDMVTSIAERMQRRRLVTIVGPGGIGKTSVAVLVAEAADTSSPDGTHWIDLGGAGPGASVAETIVAALGLGRFAEDQSAGILTWFGQQRILLVLDSCDRVISGVAALCEQILRDTPNVRILVTSREVLKVESEYVVRLPSLQVPELTENLNAAQAMTYSAVQLFVGRASAVLGHFELREADVNDVVRICHRLDGIALAIELAAGQLVAIELHTLAKRLQDKFRVLEAARRTPLDRHRTMHAVLEWSFETLASHEQAVLQYLSIFEGAATLEDLLAVASDSGFPPTDLIGSLARLVDKSLVNPLPGSDGIAYRLLDTTRAFALNAAREAGISEALAERHARHVFTGLQLRSLTIGDRDAAGLTASRRHILANAQAALSWATEAELGDDLRLPLSVAVARLLLELSLAEQCRRHVTQALTTLANAQQHHPQTRMILSALMGFASFYAPGPIDETLRMLTGVRQLSEKLANGDFIITSLWGLWSIHMFRGEAAKALLLAEEVGRICGPDSEPIYEILHARMLGMSLHLLGHQDAARLHLRQVRVDYNPTLHATRILALHVNHGDMAEAYLARVAWLQGEPARALAIVADALANLESANQVIALCHVLFEVAIPLYILAGKTDQQAETLTRLKFLAQTHGLATFQAGAAWLATVLALLKSEDVFASCREAYARMQTCQYATQNGFIASLIAQEALRRNAFSEAAAWLDPYLGDDCESLWWRADLLRLKAELEAATANARADSLFEEALATARKQQAPTLELRVLIGMAQSAVAEVNRKAARQRLQTLCLTYAVGAEMPELQIARSLL